MTKDMAIEILQRELADYEPVHAHAQALKMAIEAMEQEPTTKNDLGVDCISREQALVAIRNLYPSMPRVDFNGSLRKLVDKYKPYIECDDAIKELPSVTPQEPKIVPIAEIKYDEDKLKELINRSVLTVIPQEPRWIPVSERLPQESLNSIIGWDDYRKRCVLVQYIDGHFQITGKSESFDVKAWMPLPKSYSEVTE